jgi:hypothetical protein
LKLLVGTVQSEKNLDDHENENPRRDRGMKLNQLGYGEQIGEAFEKWH